MLESISKYIDAIQKTGEYFSIAKIDHLRELQIRIRTQFNRTLGVDALALYSKREDERPNTSHELRGFHQILEDYSVIVDLLRRIKLKNSLLKIAKPIVIILGLLIIAFFVLAVTDSINKVFILVPPLGSPGVLSKTFCGLLIVFLVGLVGSIYCKTRGDLHLDKINLILMEYDPLGEIHPIITVGLSSKDSQAIEESKKEL